MHTHRYIRAVHTHAVPCKCVMCAHGTRYTHTTRANTTHTRGRCTDRHRIPAAPGHTRAHAQQTHKPWKALAERPFYTAGKCCRFYRNDFCKTRTLFSKITSKTTTSDKHREKCKPPPLRCGSPTTFRRFLTRQHVRPGSCPVSFHEISKEMLSRVLASETNLGPDRAPTVLLQLPLRFCRHGPLSPHKAPVAPGADGPQPGAGRVSAPAAHAPAAVTCLAEVCYCFHKSLSPGSS